MTREEAISELKSTSINLGRVNGKMIYNEALYMAIKALEQQTDDDTISRQKAINAVHILFNKCDTQDIIDYRDMMVEGLKVLPSAQPDIIRCRDCKHYTLKPSPNSQRCYVRHCTRSPRISTKPDEFCSRAERRTDGVDS